MIKYRTRIDLISTVYHRARILLGCTVLRTEQMMDRGGKREQKQYKTNKQINKQQKRKGISEANTPHT